MDAAQPVLDRLAALSGELVRLSVTDGDRQIRVARAQGARHGLIYDPQMGTSPHLDRAVQVFGGMGFCRDLPIERYYRDARIYRIFDGTSEIHRTVMARSLLKGDTRLYDPYAA